MFNVTLVEQKCSFSYVSAGAILQPFGLQKWIIWEVILPTRLPFFYVRASTIFVLNLLWEGIAKKEEVEVLSDEKTGIRVAFIVQTILKSFRNAMGSGFVGIWKSYVHHNFCYEETAAIFQVLRTHD